jgi:hypothetical protein
MRNEMEIQERGEKENRKKISTSAKISSFISSSGGDVWIRDIVFYCWTL